jgi:PAS domain S-box-containing protein
MQSEPPRLGSEQQFRTLADAIPQLAWMARADGWIYWYNRRWYEYTGTTPEQMEGWGWESVHAPETLAAVLRRWKKCIATGAPFDMVFPLRGADGVFRQFLTRVQPLKNSEGRVVRWFGTNTDVDELKRAEEKLRESEERYRGIFQHAGTGIAITDLEGRFQSCNPAYTAMLGYTEEELRALVFADLVHPQDREANVAKNRRLLAGDIPSFEIVNRYIRKGGATLWVRKHISLLRDAVGRPLHIIALVTDITARKQAEQDLEASRDRLQFALDAALLGWWQYDPRRRVVSGNTRFKEIFDVTADEIPIEEIMRRVHPSDVEKGWADLEAALHPVNPKRSATEFRLRRSNGEVRWVEACGLTSFEGSGRERRAVSMVGTAQDITDRKEREEKEHLLMREINHRAKNMLSVVDAIAHQTAAKNPRDFIERFSERIQALSANQDLLIRNDWKGVEIEDLVRAQLAHFASLIDTRIMLRGPSLRLNAASAQAIGLALHELATNAGKYGALSTDKGRVDIWWQAAANMFTLSWTENEGPPVVQSTRRGFGSIVINTMVKQSLDAEVAIYHARSGLIWQMTCPEANAVEPGGRERSQDGGRSSQ